MLSEDLIERVEQPMFELLDRFRSEWVIHAGLIGGSKRLQIEALIVVDRAKDVLGKVPFPMAFSLIWVETMFSKHSSKFAMKSSSSSRTGLSLVCH